MKFPYFRSKTLSCLSGDKSICAKLEVLVYNNVVSLLQESGLKVAVEKDQFISLYNFHSQRLMFSMQFIMPLIQKNDIKPSQVISKVDEFCCEFNDMLASTTLEDDSRITIRWFMLRKLMEYFEDKDMVLEMEDSIQQHKKDKRDYKKHCFMIISNIRNENTNFRINLLKRNISLDIGCMTYKDIWPELWAKPTMQPGHRALIQQEVTDD